MVQIPIRPGWIRLGAEADGVPLWRRHGEPVYVATSDMDQLRFIGAAFARFERMSPQEFTDFVTGPGLDPELHS